MAKSSLPLLLGLGAVAVVASKKKKKKKTTTSTEGALADATDTGKKDDPYGGLPSKSPYGGESTGTPKPKPSTGGGSKIPSGNPPNSAGAGEYGNYDHGHWDSQAKIFEAFLKLGYDTPEGRTTMNDPGPDKKLGGNDDVKSAQVEAFQKDYNAVSKSKTFGSNMGGLNPDGFVGPKVLNGLKYVLDNLKGKNWKADVVKGAADKGFKA